MTSFGPIYNTDKFYTWQFQTAMIRSAKASMASLLFLCAPFQPYLASSNEKSSYCTLSTQSSSKRKPIASDCGDTPTELKDIGSQDDSSSQ